MAALHRQELLTLAARGRAGGLSQTIDRGAKPEKQDKKLEKAVAKLLRNFPPKKEGRP
jgi:hypothetical protein